MLIRSLEWNDIALVEEMPTGIEDDYVVRIIKRLIKEDEMAGYFEAGKLIGIAGMTLYEGEAAVLGRLRTHIDYRGKGVASALMNFLRKEAHHNSNVKWIGYATEEYNIAGNRLAPHLHMKLEAVIVSSRISPHTVSGDIVMSPFQKVTGTEKKGLIEKEWENNSHSFFPYSIYYPLPFVPDLSSSYIDSTEIFVNEYGSFMMTKEEKGASYLHVKVSNETVLYSKEMWEIASTCASEEARTIWVDLPMKEAKWLEMKSHQTIWHLYGQKRSYQNEMDRS